MNPAWVKNSTDRLIQKFQNFIRWHYFFYNIRALLIFKTFFMPRNTSTNGSKKNAGSSAKSEETMLKELFIEELRDIYWAEKHLTKALPKMKKAATSEELATAFEDHLAQTEKHIERVEKVFELLEMTPRAKKCEAMDGLVKEAQNIIEEMPKGS